MTNGERLIIQLLAESWNLFLQFPPLHDDDKTEFRQAIHAAQNIILARAGLRELRGEKPEEKRDD